jgi:hypothetical protein
VKRDEPTTTVETITPKLATKWLEANTHNRPLAQQHADFLAREMKAGAWRLTNQGIAFDYNGVLIDGQHRLWAIVLSETSVRMNVTRGLDPEAQDAIDVNIKARTNGDIFVMNGDKQGKKRAEIINGIRRIINAPKGKIGQQEAVALSEKYGTGIDWALTLPERNKCGPTSVRAALAFAHKTDPEKIPEFADQVWRGVGLNESDPAYLLRGILLGTRDARAHYDQRTIAVKTLRAAMAFIHDEPMRTLYATEEAVRFFGTAHGLNVKGSQEQGPTAFVGKIKRKAAKVAAKRGAA